jgi:2,3-bisphosphoglycerate-independent phosphoglycerate mutase
VSRPKPVLLLVLDGFGYREDPTDNAIAAARTPTWDRLWARNPHTLIATSGLRVGLPEGQMGNSEVGHMNLGAGRVVYQDLTRIEAAIRDGSFHANPALCGAIDAVRERGTLHVLGLLSPGGVHSHEEQIFAFLRLAARRGAGRIVVHAFLDGRDTPPRSAEASLRALDQVCSQTGAVVATVSGRYYAMDRDQRWPRLQRAWDAIVDARSPDHADSPLAALAQAYARDETDEFVAPTVIGSGARICDGDAVVFMNFRADRARQLTHAFVDPGFGHFARRRPVLLRFVTLTEYEAGLPVQVAFAAQDLHNGLAEFLSAQGLTQLRIAETEKYAHVTFFFGGGREAPWPGEERILVPSPKVATYDLQPEMSCPEVVARLTAAIAGGRFDFIVCNLANPDMVGHTGVFAAAVQAVETIDAALASLESAILAAGGEMLVTADHGNLEQMRDPATGQAHTAHTTGPVPLVYVGQRPLALRAGGSLQDVAPTVLALMGLTPPPEMTGHNLASLRDRADG